MTQKFNEDELRRKIREQLEREHSEKQETRKDEDPVEQTPVTPTEEDESYYLEVYIRRKLQEEVYSKRAEFVKCGNHLDQIRWLTPLEMEEEFEFFPLDYTFWERMGKKFSREKKVKIPNTPEINKMIEDFRHEIEQDADARVKHYKNYLKENQKHIHDDLEKKIFEEEQERFYRNKKGYHKYKNHINETTWMTKNEFEHQDEFTDRVYTPLEKFRQRVLAGTLLAVLLVGAYWVNTVLNPQTQKAYVVVDIGVQGSLYINHELAVGFTPGVPYVMDEGTHEITVVASGYQFDPPFKTVDITLGDTAQVAFKHTAIAGNQGVVRLNVPFSDAAIFVDGKFRGSAQTSAQLSLQTGDHSITVKKDNYIAVPQLHTFSLNAGDTVDLAFHLSPQKSKTASRRASSAINLGLIEVNTNVRDAEILLNGQRTGFMTDCVLQKIPFGQHIVRVEKEGYKVYPKEQAVRLSKDKRQAKIAFKLTSLSRLVYVDVYPAKATLSIDGKKMPQGSFSGTLPIGRHTITFNDVEGYITPAPQEIEVKKDGQTRFEYKYGSALSFTFSPQKVTPSPSLIQVSSGYIMNGINFKANASNGPDVINHPNNSDKMWNMGFAFQYKNPPGTDALLIRFITPTDLNITKDVKLRLWLYHSKEKYPLILGNKSEYRVILNNVILSDHKAPRYSLDELSETTYEEISISQHLRAGRNMLIIATDTENARFLKLWKAEIR